MMETSTLETCRVKCDTCGAEYVTVTPDDEIPTICECCHTPSLRVLDYLSSLSYFFRF
jgi:hypothetical protein